MARVFISHSSRDNQQAAEMLEWLRRQGFDRAFLDIDKHAGIPPGARWERQLYQEIESAQAVILVLTPNWLDSKWCFAEFTQARALGKAIFPVIYAPGGESFIAPDIQNLDLRSDHQGGLERLGRELTRLALDAQGGFAWDPARAPYPGLLSFEKEDAAIFFGRDDDSNLLIERLNARRVQGEPKVLALLGASGSGKSSLLRAGVLPRLERDRRNWIVLPPFRPRHDPFAELARAAAEALGAPEEWRTWRDRFAAELPAALEDLADRLRIKAGAREAQVLLSIDQGEELFAISPEEATRFFALVKTAVADESPFVALLALRSDYLGHLQRSAAGVFRFQEYSLAPMPLARVRQIIEGPARVAGLEVEDALVEAAMRDAGTEDALPLLAFTLRELYDRYAGGATSSDRQLLLAHYLQLADPAAGLNPLENSVRRRADEVTSELGADDLEALRNGFVESLVRVNSEGQYVRRPARWDELPERARPVLERLAGARLLVLGEEGGQRTAEVAHEALLRKWPRLTSWLDQKRDFLVGQTQLDGALADWQRAADADKPEALLGGLFLRRAAQWLVEHPRALSDAERIFVKESLRREAAIRRRRRLVAGGAIAAVVVFVAAIAFLLVRSVQGRRAVAAAQQRSAASLLALESRTALQAGETERAVVAATKAFDFLPTAETRSTLLQTLVALSPNLSRSITIDKLEPTFLAWLPGSERLLVGGSNGRIVGWRPAAGFAIEEVSSPADGPYVPPSLRGLVATGERRGLAVLGDGQLVRFEVDGNNGGASTTALAVDVRLAALGESGASALIASFAEGTVFSVDCRRPSGCRKAPIASGYATALALNERTVTAAVALEEGSVGGRLYVFDLSQGLPASPTIELATEFRIQSLAYDRAGHVLAAGGPGGDSFVIDAQGARRALPEQEAVTALAWNPADGRLAFACGSSVCISSTPGEGAAPLRPARRLAGHANTVVSLAWAPSGDTLASASTDGLVKLWQDRPDGWVARTLTAPDPPSSLTDLEVSADRRWIAAGTAQGGIHVWDARPLTLAGSLPNDGSRAAVRSLRWHPSRPWIAQADAAGIVVRSWPDGRTVSRIDLSAEPVEAILWAHSGASLFAALSTGRLVEWPLGGQPKPFSREHPESANALALEPRSHRLLSSDSLGNLWLWDSQSRKFAAQLGNLGQPVGTVAFDRAGTMALAAGNAGTLALYDMKAPPRESWRPSPGGALIESAAFSPDGQLVAAVNVEGYLHVWSLARREIDLSVKLYPDGAPGHLSKVVWLPERAALAVSTSRGEVKLISTDVKEWLARARSVFQGAQSPSK